MPTNRCAPWRASCPISRLAGYWWHNFFPDIIRQIIGERLDMLPTNKQIGFFSDAYCVEWTYAKALLVRKQLARVLAERIDQGQYSLREALKIAEAILYESPQQLLGMAPRTGEVLSRDQDPTTQLDPPGLP